MSDYLPARDFERRFVRPKRGRTLIVGSKLYEGREDRRALYEDAYGVDMLPGDGVDLVLNLEGALPDGLGKFAHVECMSVLEHSKQPWKLAKNIVKLMERGGTIHLSAPFVWRTHNFPDDYFRYTKSGIRALFSGIAWEQMAYAHERLALNDLVPVLEKGVGHPYLARSEVICWGRKL